MVFHLVWWFNRQTAKNTTLSHSSCIIVCVGQWIWKHFYKKYRRHQGASSHTYTLHCISFAAFFRGRSSLKWGQPWACDRSAFSPEFRRQPLRCGYSAHRLTAGSPPQITLRPWSQTAIDCLGPYRLSTSKNVSKDRGIVPKLCISLHFNFL